jgi:hypothetical protein
MKITGIKKAVSDYKRANAGGYYSPSYGRMMLNRSTGEVWTDEFYCVGHTDWNKYDDPAIINIVTAMNNIACDAVTVTMQSIKKIAVKLCEEYAKNKTKNS